MEAMTGLLYVAVLIARLVSLYSIPKSNDSWASYCWSVEGPRRRTWRKFLTVRYKKMIATVALKSYRQTGTRTTIFVR